MAEKNIEYAGFWLRVGATIIDTLLFMAVTFPLLASIYGWAYFDPEKTGFIAGPADLLVTWILPMVAVILFWRLKQATPGKMALSAKIVDAKTGNPISLGQSIGRYVAGFVSVVPLGLGLIWVAFDKKKQAWHDKLAGTVVIKKRIKTLA